MKKFIQKFIPQPLLLLYHKTLAILANIIYRFPSRELTVIGVTGTNGKTTTCNLIWSILTKAHYKVGLTSSINFKIGEREWVNNTKQGMQGRFRLQKLLRQMVREGCQYAVIETTSEGIKQYRHFGIDYSVAVFTNLTPEHIESHGSFLKYKEAKGRLFHSLLHCYIVTLLDFFRDNRRNKKEKKISIVNGDDEYGEYFFEFPADEKWVYTMQKSNPSLTFDNNYIYGTNNYVESENQKLVRGKIKNQKERSKYKILEAHNYHLLPNGAQFVVGFDEETYSFQTKLLGLFNIYNCLAAIATGLSQGIEMNVIQSALEEVNPIPGRMEIIRDEKRGITIIVDYAHDPAALKQVYETIEMSNVKCQMSNVIAVLGAVGGGRDKAKRPLLGALASKYASHVILTNEDPYDDVPMEIIEQVEEGVKQDQARILNKNYWKILDRKEAIKKALELAQSGDIIALTGKGAEEVMAVKGGFVPWDDRKVVRYLIQ